jgi:hypothetical protein
MFEKTVKPNGKQINAQLYNCANSYTFIFSDPELDKIYDKHKGFMTVKISAPICSKTLKQLATAHALITAFYLSGMASLPENCTLEKFKFLQKIAFGPCEWVEYQGQKFPIPLSMSKYTKMELKDFIDCLLSEIKQSGAENDKKIQQILNGMEKEK